VSAERLQASWRAWGKWEGWMQNCNTAGKDERCAAHSLATTAPGKSIYDLVLFNPRKRCKTLFVQLV